MSEFRPEKSELWLMNAVAEASELLRSVAGPGQAGDSVKGAINRATKRVARFIAPHFAARWHAGRAEDIWRREARGVWAEEMDAIRAAADARAAQEARNEFHALQARIATLEAAVGIPDEEFGGPHADALRQSRGAVDRPLDQD